MAEEIKCCLCGRIVNKKPSNEVSRRTGRPWKRQYCSMACYVRERANQHLAVKARWLKFQRQVWGTTELKRMDVAKSKAFGRRGEVLARDRHLPDEGFTEIADFSRYSNQFFVDFIATHHGERVLVDATIKLKAYIPEKIRLAKALKMRLFIIHISISDPTLYFLHEVPTLNNSVTRVPAGFIRELAIKKGLV